MPLSLGLPTARVYLSPTVFTHYQTPPQLVQPYFYAARPSLPGPTPSAFFLTETDKLVTELAELGAKHFVTAVAQLPNVNPQKKAQFQRIGLVGVTPEETERAFSLLKELGELSGKKAPQLAKFANLAPLLKNLADLGSNTSKGSKIAKLANLVPLLKNLGIDSEASGIKSGLEILESIGLDLDSGLANLKIGDGLKLLSKLSSNDGGASFKSLSDLTQLLELLGDGSLSFGASGSTSTIKSLDTPEFRAQLDKTNELLTELAELGASYIISAVADLPGLSPEKRWTYKSIGVPGPVEEARLNSLLKELRELGAVVTKDLTAVSDKSIRLGTELAELGAKYVVSAVADLPDVDPKKRALFQEIGLTGITSQEKARVNSLLLELQELVADASIDVASTASNGLTQEKAGQFAKFAKLVPALKGLTDLTSNTASDHSNSIGDGLELLDTIGLDLETGLAFLRKNNLDVSDGLKLLNAAAGDKNLGSISQLLSAGSLSLGATGGASASFQSLSDLTQLLGDGSLSLGATGGASAYPELKAELEKTKKVLTELAELGAVFVVSVAAEVPTISSEKRLIYKKVGPFGEKEKARLNSLLSELSEVSVAVTESGSKVPGLASLEKLVPILQTLAEVSVVSDSEETLPATRNIFSSLPLTAAASRSDSFGGLNKLCNGRSCIANPSAGYPGVFHTNPRSYKLTRFVHF